MRKTRRDSEKVRADGKVKTEWVRGGGVIIVLFNRGRKDETFKNNKVKEKEGEGVEEGGRGESRRGGGREV